MKNALVVASFVGISALMAQLASCSSGTVSPDGGSGGGSGGTVSGGGSGGTVSGGGSGGTPVTEGGAGAGGSPGTDAGTTVPLIATANGYLSPAMNSAIGVSGAWYAFGDNWGTNGQPPGNCESVGLFPTSDCSLITSPPPSVVSATDPEAGPSGFPQTAANEFCLSGYAAKVLDYMNDAGVGYDYSDIFGIGFGVNLNNPMGTPMAYNAMANNVIGFSFTITGTAATAGVRFSVPTFGLPAAEEAFNFEITADGPTTVLFSQLGHTAYTPPAGTPMTFDPTMIQNLQWQVISNSMGTNPPTAEPDGGMGATICISQLAAIIQ